MKHDADIQKHVEAELRWSPDLDHTDIAVKVKDGEVTLSGYARTYLEKYQAESAVKRVKGVAAIANDLTVRTLAGAPTDPEIARAAVSALKFELPTIWERIKTIVQEGGVRLEGVVEWHYQREAAESAVRRLQGVLSVLNSIRVEPQHPPQDIKDRIDEAFRRIAHVDAEQITVEAEGSEVTLRGEVRSWAERDQAQQTAWAAPGVTKVHNELTIRT